MKNYAGVYTYLHAILNSEVDGVRWSDSRPGRFIPRERAPRNPFDRRLGGPQSRYGRDGEEKIPGPDGNETPVIQPAA
jgi:hypothetical protein